MGRKRKETSRWRSRSGHGKVYDARSSADSVLRHLEWAKKALTGDEIVAALTAGSLYTGVVEVRAGIREAVSSGLIEPIEGGKYLAIGKVRPPPYDPVAAEKSGHGPRLAPAHTKGRVRRHRPGVREGKG